MKLSEELQRDIRPIEFDKLAKVESVADGITQAVDLYLRELEYFSERASVDVVMCALPDALLDYMADGIPTDMQNSVRTDFRDLLKARSMRLGIHTQVIRPSTYDESKRKRQKNRPEKIRSTQDEATRMWNLYTALYYKAKGTPWRLVRDTSQLT